MRVLDCHLNEWSVHKELRPQHTTIKHSQGLENSSVIGVKLNKPLYSVKQAMQLLVQVFCLCFVKCGAVLNSLKSTWISPQVHTAVSMFSRQAEAMRPVFWFGQVTLNIYPIILNLGKQSPGLIASCFTLFIFYLG